MKMLHVATLSILAAAAAALPEAQAAEQFGLACRGERTDTSGKTQPWQDQYSIDLASKKYCRQGCDAPKNIARVDPDQLVLEDSGPTTNRPEDRNDKTKITIKRSDGAYDAVVAMISLGVYMKTKGSCEIVDFTPLPKTKF